MQIVLVVKANEITSWRQSIWFKLYGPVLLQVVLSAGSAKTTVAECALVSSKYFITVMSPIIAGDLHWIISPNLTAWLKGKYLNSSSFETKNVVLFETKNSNWSISIQAILILHKNCQNTDSVTDTLFHILYKYIYKTIEAGICEILRIYILE